MPDAHQARRARLRERMAARDLPSLLITRLVNVRYLTGFTGSNGALLVTHDAAVLATDGRYVEQSARQAPDVERLIERAVAAALAERAGAVRLGFEAHDVTVELHEALGGKAAGELVAAGRLVEELRAVKDEDEIALLREACRIADRALADLLAADGLRPGRSEREVAVDLERRMVDHGAEAPSFESIVASGPNSAVPHHRPTHRALERGEFVKLDFGATYQGYHSDMTRTVVLGEPAGWQRELYDLVAESQRVGREALRVGAEARHVDAAARRVIDDAGHGENYTHGLGHGVGLEIHEAPTLGYNAAGTLAERMPVTVEPGVYLAGRGGVRIEDTLVVRADGPELLTTTTKDLVVL